MSGSGSRVKAAAQRAPQTIEAATALLVKFADIDLERALIEAAKAETIAQATAKADAALVPLIAELKDIAKQLKPWWAASIDALTQGERKSIKLGGCDIGYRLPPPKVTFEHGKDEDGVAAIQAAARATNELTAELNELLRVKPALDKPAILKALDGGEEDELATKLAEIGFASSQKEEFFVARSGGALNLGDVGSA